MVEISRVSYGFSFTPKEWKNLVQTKLDPYKLNHPENGIEFSYEDEDGKLSPGFENDEEIESLGVMVWNSSDEDSATMYIHSLDFISLQDSDYQMFSKNEFLEIDTTKVDDFYSQFKLDKSPSYMLFRVYDA